MSTVDIVTNESFSEVQLVTEEYSENPTSTPLPSTLTAVSFMKIEFNIPSEAITQATIRFRVAKSTVTSLGLDPSSIQLYRLDTTWSPLSTSLLAQDGDYYYYEAISPGFSYFAITGRAVVAESVPPTITSFSPEGTVTERRPTITVTYSDNVGIDLLSARLLIDNVDVTALATLNSTTLIYKPPADLSEGNHSIYFEIKDISGNKASKSWSIIVSLPVLDTIPPVISALKPVDGSLLENAMVTISASYSDNVAIDVSSVVLKVDNKDVTAQATVTATGISYSTTLEEGTHSVSLTVKDTSGNTATSTWSFIIKLPLPDTTPPTITINSPGKDSVLSSKSVVISASYSDNVAIDVSSVVLKVDNKDVTAQATVTATGISYSTTLEEGTHSVSLTVKDTSGNTATSTWSFIIRLPVDYAPYIIAAVVVIVIIAIIAFVLIRKK